MKREFLKDLGLDEEAVNKIMAENGRDIEKVKAEAEKTSAELDQVKSDLEKANATLEGFKDYDNVKAEVEKYKTEAEKSKSEFEQKIQKMELQAKVKDFTSSKRFVNDLTRKAINSSLEEKLNEEANKGRSLEELLNEITEGQENIFVKENNPVPPVAPNMIQKNNSEESGVLSAFKKLNPAINLEQ